MKVCDRAGIKLATPDSAVRLAFVARHITNCATRPSIGFWESGIQYPVSGKPMGELTFLLMTVPTRFSYVQFSSMPANSSWGHR